MISDYRDKSRHTAENKALNEQVSNHDDIIVRINEVKKYQADQADSEIDGIDDVVIMEKDKKRFTTASRKNVFKNYKLPQTINSQLNW
ncbi:hypothetical protein [Rosenbergiella australiborealis]|uniref:hypothetical protein n=1 Tax=Rosenbergiella australiborealis TaxID=1544696 RepID=UPI001F4F0996|nr:hypothetical protein [Rosenbergiella australiborealis]